MDAPRSEIKITVAKLIELAWSKDKGLTTKIMAGGGAAITVDQNGDARLTGKAGVVVFSGKPAIDQLGAKVKRVSVNFTNGPSMKVRYAAAFDMEIMVWRVTGEFDLEALITSCSGLLCRAARAIKGRHKAYDLELQRIMEY